MSRAPRSADEPSGELVECHQDPAILKLDDLLSQTPKFEIKTEPDEFIFENLNCGDLLTQGSQQTSDTPDDLTIGDQGRIYPGPGYLNQPTYSQPLFSQSTYSQSTSSQPTDFQSTYSQPTYSQPTYSQSTYSQNDQPVCSQESRINSLFSSLPTDSDRLDSSLALDSNSQPTTGSSWSGYPFGSQTISLQSASQPSQNESLFEDEHGDVFRQTVMMRLEILMKVLYGKGLFFNDRILVAKKCWENANFEGSIRMNYQDNCLRYQRIRRASRIALLMMSAKIYLLLAENRVTSRRQIYYEEKDVFTARKCYELIEQVCAFVNLSRRELNIVATGKGLVAGNLVLLFENRTAIDVSQFRKGCLIPDSLIYLSGLVTSAKCALVIEKDATFAKLVDAGFHLLHNVILITSKGFPDVYTRELVNLLSDRFGLQTYGLFDCDPFGIDIYCCFKFGSVNLIHHSIQISSPKIVWLGIYPTEIAFLKLKSVPFNETDERRLASLLKRAYLTNDQFLSNELATLSQTKVKSGLQDLEETIFSFILFKTGYHLPGY